MRDGAHDGEPRTALLKKIVKELELDDPKHQINNRSHDSLPLAILEEDTRSVADWAFLRPWLRKYVGLFPASQMGDYEVADVDTSMAVILDQGNFFLTPTLIKHHHRNEPPMGLGEFADNRYNREKANSSWNKYQHLLTARGTANKPGIFRAALTLQLWLAIPVFRADGQIGRWQISAGQALIDFDEYVFQPLRDKQLRRFFDRFYRDKKER
jgi:hypothetical protein